MIAHRLVESEPSTPPSDVAAATRDDRARTATSSRSLATSDDGFAVRVIEIETSAARTSTCRSSCSRSPIYARRAHDATRSSPSIVGAPPFTLTHGKKRERAETFEELREQALDLAKEGIQVSRFKGLGEMNAEQLWETTMDPSERLLIRVEVEDASAADAIFSMLMGDQVEPRREFIEQNAETSRFLDV